MWNYFISGLEFLKMVGIGLPLSMCQFQNPGRLKNYSHVFLHWPEGLAVTAGDAIGPLSQVEAVITLEQRTSACQVVVNNKSTESSGEWVKCALGYMSLQDNVLRTCACLKIITSHFNRWFLGICIIINFN